MPLHRKEKEKEEEKKKTSLSALQRASDAPATRALAIRKQSCRCLRFLTQPRGSITLTKYTIEKSRRAQRLQSI